MGGLLIAFLREIQPVRNSCPHLSACFDIISVGVIFFERCRFDRNFTADQNLSFFYIIARLHACLTPKRLDAFYVSALFRDQIGIAEFLAVLVCIFIALCRIAGIPARWESGFAVAPGDAGCHDWARFYVAPKGWMYADCSYGASMARRGDEVLRRHYFGSLDTGRMVANSAFEAPFDPPMLGFRSDPYDNQSGEMEADGVGLYGDDTVTTKEVLKFEEVE